MNKLRSLLIAINITALIALTYVASLSLTAMALQDVHNEINHSRLNQIEFMEVGCDSAACKSQSAIESNYEMMVLFYKLQEMENAGAIIGWKYLVEKIKD